MSQKIIDIITLLINKFDSHLLTENNIEEIKESLKSYGLSEKEIGKALKLIEKNLQVTSKVKLSAKGRFRVQSDIEKHIISKNAYSMLNQLLFAEEINETEFETIIDHIMVSGLNNVTEYEVAEFLHQLGFSFEAKARRKYINFIQHSKPSIN